MRRSTAALAAAAVLITTSLTAMPAQAALTCAADAYEPDDATAAPIAVGGSVSRAICQDRTTGADIDWFVFDAVGGKAYSAAITSAGSALNLGTLDGLDVAGVFRLNPDGTRTTIEAPDAESYERFTTPVLAAGRYQFVAAIHDEVAYPDNYLGLKPVEGQAGTYTVKLTEALPAPSVTSITVPTLKTQTRSTGSYTLSGPAPTGGISLFGQADNAYVSVPRIWIPAGATRGSFTIDTGRATKGSRITISATTRVGSPVSATTTVK